MEKIEAFREYLWKFLAFRRKVGEFREKFVAISSKFVAFREKFEAFRGKFVNFWKNLWQLTLYPYFQ